MTTAETPPPRRALHLDIEKYQTYFDNTDISHEDKDQMIEALWHIVISFVFLDYDICPSLEGRETSCGRNHSSASDSDSTDYAVHSIYTENSGRLR